MWALVRNTSKLPIRLRSFDRDSTKIPPKKATRVDPKFLWQLPAEVLLIDRHASINADGTPAIQKPRAAISAPISPQKSEKVNT